MERHAMAVEIKKGRMNEFRRKLGEIWEELVKWLDKNGIKNFSIWNAENLIFIYGEWQYGGGYRIDDEIRQIVLRISDTFTWISEPGKDVRLMYHNFGILRESKELIRHRVFMTKLHEGCEEEYKRRHDELISQRGDTIDPGPDSNFSIWSAEGYIFGYDEIDITMEKEETEEERKRVSAWEMRRLEIMDWITNDVDWLTGECHVGSVRLAWHA